MNAAPRGLFVTGTDTGAGKTALACGLLRAFTRAGYRAAGMKPIAAGATVVAGRWINGDVEALRAASTVAAARKWINPYLFKPPIAPHIAAAEAGVAVELKRIVTAYRTLASHADAVVVEGVGGFRVPLAKGVDTGDLAKRLRLPVILVVGMRLGCLSHALIATEAIAARGLMLAGWVANRIDPHMQRPRENIATLRERLPAPLIAEIPFRARRAARDVVIDRCLCPDQICALAGVSAHSR